MTAYLYSTRVRHVRELAPRREFSYRSYSWLVDLDDLPRLPRLLGPFARIESRDHLGEPGRPIRANLDDLLAQHRIDLEGGRVLMLANARVLGYVFNPLTVYWCYTANSSLACVVAEVHNTYGQRHTYVLDTDAEGRADVTKTFYVSPFLPVRGYYRMRLRPPGELLALDVVLRDGTRTLLAASLRGVRLPVTVGNLLRLTLRHPLAPLGVSARIRFQGVWLWLRRVPIEPRPRTDQT